MKIALLGAPGSGKSQIGRKLVRRLNTEVRSWTLIDGYVEKLRDRTEWPFGTDTNIRNSVQVLGERWTLEDAAQKKGMSTVTCGTLYESLIYSAVQSVRIPFLEDETLIAEESYVAEVNAAMMAVLERRSFDYDILLSLPLDNPQDDWDTVIDAKLSEVLEGFGRVAFVLDGTDKQKVNRAIAIITAVKEATTNDQLGVRGGRETSEGSEHPPGDVSDVSEQEE